jgi:nuclear pore complex protein Nup205
MAEATTLDALQALHRDLAAVRSKRADGLEALDNPSILDIYEKELGKIWEPSQKSDKSRNDIKTGSY